VQRHGLGVARREDETGRLAERGTNGAEDIGRGGFLVAVEPGAHAILFVDRAGWHVTAKLDVPEHMTLFPLPSKSPELNPVENIWQYMRDNWLSNRIFANYEDILDHCCFNWNKLVERPWLIMSIGTRRWAHG
jgi:transposase